MDLEALEEGAVLIITPFSGGARFEITLSTRPFACSPDHHPGGWWFRGLITGQAGKTTILAFPGEIMSIRPAPGGTGNIRPGIM